MAKEHKPAPDVLAMMLADAVHTDRATGKNYILGTYSTLFSPTFPFMQQLVVVFLALTDGHGQTHLKMRLIDVDEANDPLFESNTLINFQNPAQVMEVVFAQGNVVFPAPGEYTLQLFCSGQFLRQRRLQVVAVQQQQPK